MRTERKSIKPRKLKFAIYSMVPCIVLMVLAEVTVRVLGLAKPALLTVPLTEEEYGVLQADALLFWSNAPGINKQERFPWVRDPMRISTNSQGTRGSEIGTKSENEYRILSLGESTTFGVFVSDEETYSARLEQMLNTFEDGTNYRVINAGVSAYSSFQSLKFLKVRGLNLRPDMVLFYHELNDYLPTSLRSGGNNEIGLGMTDKQLYESRRGIVSRHLTANSALLRFLIFRRARSQLDEFKKSLGSDRAREIGLPRIGARPRLVDNQDRKTLSSVNHESLPRRVSAEERKQILAELHQLCKSEGVRLVMIHPSYAHTVAHECILTRFCRANNVAMFEAHQVLHPVGVPINNVYIDVGHPTAEGHDRLARALTHYIRTLLQQ